LERELIELNENKFQKELTDAAAKRISVLNLRMEKVKTHNERVVEVKTKKIDDEVAKLEKQRQRLKDKLEAAELKRQQKIEKVIADAKHFQKLTIALKNLNIGNDHQPAPVEL